MSGSGKSVMQSLSIRTRITRPRPAGEIAAVFGLAVLVSIACALWQPPITLHEGRGWDGVFYDQLARQLAAGQLPATEAPFVFRIGTPLLVALVPGSEVLLKFKLVNIAGSFVCVGLLWVWLRLFLQSAIVRIGLCALFITQWHAPLRFTYFYPAYVDVWALAGVLAGLILIERLRRDQAPSVLLLLSLLCFVGVALREMLALLGGSVLFLHNPLRRRRARAAALPGPRSLPGALLLLPLGAALLGLGAVQLLVQPTTDYPFAIMGLFWLYYKPPWRYVLGAFVAYGPLIAILAYHWRVVGAFLVRRQYQLAFLGGVALLAWMGGTDTERIFYWACPVVYLLIGYSVESAPALFQSPLLPAVLGVSQGIAQRIFWPLPDYPGTPAAAVLFTPLGAAVPYLDLYSYHADQQTAVVALVEYLLFTLLLLGWLFVRQRRERAAPSPPLPGTD